MAIPNTKNRDDDKQLQADDVWVHDPAKADVWVHDPDQAEAWPGDEPAQIRAE